MITSRISAETTTQTPDDLPQAEPRPEDVPTPEPKPVPKNIPNQEEILKKLEIDSIDEEFVYYIQQTTPNDPDYPQWYTNKINAPLVWDTTTGSANTTVAVIDTGYSLGHEDLASAWAINSGEQGQTSSGDFCWTGAAEDKQTNNCDDDQNGYIDDWRGWDFVNNDNSSQTNEHGYGASHGTMVSGFVGARSDNNTGVAALNWQTKILPLQGLADFGFGYTTDIVAAIVYAVDMDVDVINLSLGGPYSDPAMEAAIEYAHRNNVIVVAAAGNCGEGQSYGCYGTPPGGMTYPARYQHVIAVGATKSNDQRASFSSYGPELDVVAPGSGTMRTPTWTENNPTTAYAGSSFGTSFASPVVASAVALFKADQPQASFNDVYFYLKDSAAKVSGMNNQDFHEQYGWGRLDAYQALQSMIGADEDLEKGVDTVIDAPTVAPTVRTSTGQTSAYAITKNQQVNTICQTTQSTVCVLEFTNQDDNSVVTFDPAVSGIQGVANWNWKGSDLYSGTWDLVAKSNSLDSEVETIFIR